MQNEEDFMLHQRVVCYRYKPGVMDKDIEAQMNDFRKLADTMTEIMGYNGGKTVAGDDGKMPHYHSLHYLTFRNLEDVHLYFKHPDHQDFIRRYEHIWEDVLVVNAALEIISDAPSQQPQIDEY
jgi:hypothetical protein